MNLELDTQRITYFEPVVDTILYQEETGENIVPDSCPDIAQIISASGIPVLSERTVQAGKGELAGTVKATVLYQPESTRPLQRLELTIPFRCTISGAGIPGGGHLFAIPKLHMVEARVLNPRKVLLRVNLAIRVQLFAPKTQNISCGIQSADLNAGTEQLFAPCNTYYPISVQEKSFTFTDELPLNGGRTGVEAILEQRIEFQCTETKIIGSKLIFKGEAVLYLLCRNGERLERIDYKLPFSQIMEVAELGEHYDCGLQLQLTGLECELGGESGLVYVAMEVLAQAVIREQRELNALCDLYSTAGEAEAFYQTFEYDEWLSDGDERLELRELVEIEQVVRSVLDARAELGAVSSVREGDEFVLSAPVILRLLYLDEEEGVHAAVRTLNAVCHMDAPGEDSSCQASCQAEGEVLATPVAGGVEVRFAVGFRAILVRQKSIAIVSSASVQEVAAVEGGQERPSIVLRRMEGDENLWSLAKSCCTTRAVILAANGLEDEADCQGRMLLIPRVRS